MQKYGGIGLLAIVFALAACGGRGGVGSPTNAGLTPSIGNDMAIQFTLPKKTIGEELPSEGVHTKMDPTWGLVGGFTQSTTAQVLAFPPRTKVTITNLSKTLSHTLNVVKKVIKAPAHFPPNPSLPVQAQGNGILGVGYASGSIGHGKSVSVMLSKPGKYLIGCAFHYSEGMQDVIVVKAGATPGPTFGR
jgi:plastocyanin/predicted small lipoprotein YifL